jgi:hypothetical protein
MFLAICEKGGSYDKEKGPDAEDSEGHQHPSTNEAYSASSNKTPKTQRSFLKGTWG